METLRSAKFAKEQGDVSLFNSLREDVKKQVFKMTHDRLSKAGDGIRCYSTDGRWFISQSDIDQILEENGRV